VNILQVPPYAPPMEGGSERYCFNLSKILSSKGHHVEIYTSKIPPTTPYFETREGIPITRFFCHSYLLQINPLSFFWKALSKEVSRFDIVHVHSYIYFLANQTATVRLFKKFPFILHLHGGLDYIQPSLLGYKASALKIIYDQTLGPYTMRMADKIIPCCETDAKTAISRFGANPEKITVIPNSVYVDMFHVSDHSNPVNIVYIGRLSGLKGSYQLPQLVRYLYQKLGKKIKFTIVGDGQLRRWLEKNLKGYPVIFTGSIPNKQIPDILQKAGVLILPSFLEGFPLVNIEAMASSVPVVCYDVGGCWEIVKDGETGFLVPPGDLRMFKDRIEYLVENDSERRRMGRNGRKLVERKYSWKKSVVKVEEVYRDIILDVS